MGEAAGEAEAQRLCNAGRTTRVPWRTTFNTGPRRISRRLSVGQRVVGFQRNFQSSGAGRG